jgi:hypothetical protein
VYFSLKIDWAKVIGRWFPWALKNDEAVDDENHSEGKKSNNDH